MGSHSVVSVSAFYRPRRTGASRPPNPIDLLEASQPSDHKLLSWPLHIFSGTLGSAGERVGVGRERSSV